MKNFNLEADLASSEKIRTKVKDFKYAQALYAAICNNEWMPCDVMSRLRGQGIIHSWRYAGGMVARLRGRGDYMDFYCSGSGLFGGDSLIAEGTVTEEIKNDLNEVGWDYVR